MASTTLNRDSANAKIAADTASLNKQNTAIQTNLRSGVDTRGQSSPRASVDEAMPDQR